MWYNVSAITMRFETEAPVKEPETKPEEAPSEPIPEPEPEVKPGKIGSPDEDLQPDDLCDNQGDRVVKIIEDS